MNDVTILPDGSAFGVMSFPLPKDHWLYAPYEYEHPNSAGAVGDPLECRVRRNRGQETMMENQTQTLADAFPREQERVRELVKIYDEIPTGAFGASMLRLVLTRAEQAAMSGDITAVLRSYEELKGCQ